MCFYILTHIIENTFWSKVKYSILLISSKIAQFLLDFAQNFVDCMSIITISLYSGNPSALNWKNVDTLELFSTSGHNKQNLTIDNPVNKKDVDSTLNRRCLKNK